MTFIVNDQNILAGGKTKKEILNNKMLFIEIYPKIKFRKFSSRKYLQKFG